MTSAVLVSLIFGLCSQYSGDAILRLRCFDVYTNCAVQSNSKIINYDDFKQKCNFRGDEYEK